MRRFLFPLLALLAAGQAARAATPLVDPAAYGLKGAPLMGHTTHNTATLWVRTEKPAAVTVTFADNPALKNPRTVQAQTDAAHHVTAVLRLTGLKPATRYYYRPSAQGKTPRLAPGQEWPSFATLPDPAKPGKLRLGLGSCWLYWVSPNPKTFTVLKAHQPNAFVWLGDNIYGDTNEPETLWDKYMKQRQTPNLTWMNWGLPQWAIWDDHDFGMNDMDGTYPHKAASFKIFQDTWANPSYGEAGNPGVYTRVRLAGAELFLLDGRYHRSSREMADGPGKTMLGQKQLAWLKAGLKSSTAPFKLLMLGSPWIGLNNADTFSAFAHERDGLFDFIRDEKIEGVVLVRGDSHIGELNAIPRRDKGGYDLYELVASPLGNKNRGAASGKGRIDSRVRPVYWQDFNVGVLDIDTTVSPPRLGFMLYNSQNKPVWKTPFTLSANELKNGAGDWKNKVGE